VDDKAEEIKMQSTLDICHTHKNLFIQLALSRPYQLLHLLITDGSDLGLFLHEMKCDEFTYLPLLALRASPYF
jgi:hypothetical protein